MQLFYYIKTLLILPLLHFEREKWGKGGTRHTKYTLSQLFSIGMLLNLEK